MRALGDDRDLAAGLQGDARQLGDREDLERGADTQQQIGATRPAPRRGAARLRAGYSPNRTTSGLSGRPQSQRGTPCRVGPLARADVVERVAAPAGQARRVVDRPVDLDQLAGAGLGVQAIDVLGDHGVEPCPARSSVASAAWARVGALVLEASESGRRRSARSAPGRGGTRRCGRPPSGRRSPTARCCGVRKSGIPDGTEIPAPVSATTESAASDQLGQPRGRRGGAERAHRPRNRGRALAQEGGDPLASVLGGEHRARSPAFSAAIPASRSPVADDPLDLLDRQRRLAGELARPGQRRVEQLVVGHDPCGQPVLEGLDGPDRLAGQVELQRLGLRRPAGAAAGCRRSRG